MGRAHRLVTDRGNDALEVFVTGGSGFLGSHAVEGLKGDGHDVHVPRSAETDLADPDASRRYFESAKSELVFHLAANVGGFGANRENPGRYQYANLMMDVNVLAQCRQLDVDKLVVAGTIYSYPKIAPIPFREETLWEGYPEETNAPYGVAKKAVLVNAQGDREQFGLNTVYLLPVNL
jgi:nucleoside-diphosphate-sugar epimerase